MLARGAQRRETKENKPDRIIILKFYLSDFNKVSSSQMSDVESPTCHIVRDRYGVVVIGKLFLKDRLCVHDL